MKRITFALALILSLTLAAASSHAEVDWFEFKADYIAGSKDPNKQMRRGTEVMRLMAHDGKLYAALGIFMQNYSDGPLTGAQILRKDKPDGPWFVEKTFGPDYLRVDNFCEATFTQDKDGKKLSSPVTLFVAGLYAVYKRNTGHPSPAAVAVYNNKPGDWTTVKIAAPPMGPSNPMFATCRSSSPRSPAATAAHSSPRAPPLPTHAFCSTSTSTCRGRTTSRGRSHPSPTSSIRCQTGAAATASRASWVSITSATRRAIRLMCPRSSCSTRGRASARS